MIATKLIEEVIKLGGKLRITENHPPVAINTFVSLAKESNTILILNAAKLNIVQIKSIKSILGDNLILEL